jgi:hypothetical protein
MGMGKHDIKAIGCLDVWRGKTLWKRNETKRSRLCLKIQEEASDLPLGLTL